MPWRGEKDPYKIWISEIILQQTRVAQGLEYYNRFIKAFPTIHDLAKAQEADVYKLWEGLGYYTRCKNIIHTAKYISHDLNGVFPKTYEEILKLKGIGDYTASAIASFAFGLPHAVVDGNVYRVLSRYFGMYEPVDSPSGKKKFNLLANELLDKQYPGLYNQAIMDFGADVCTPRGVNCNICCLKTKCVAFKTNTVGDLPVKEKRILIKHRWFYYLVIKCKSKYYIQKRSSKDIWQNLYEFLLIETPTAHSLKEIKATSAFKKIMHGTGYTITEVSPLIKQKLTHQNLHIQFIQIEIAKPLDNDKGYELVSGSKIALLPFPKTIASYITA